MAGGWGDDSSSSEDEGDAVVITAQQVQQVVNISSETEQPISKPPPPPPPPSRQRSNYNHDHHHHGGRGGRSHDHSRGGRGGGRHGSNNQGGGYHTKGAGGGSYRIVVANGDTKGPSSQNKNRRPAPSRNWKEEAKQSSILGRDNNDGQKLDGSAWMASRREKLKEQEAEERRRQEEMKEKQAEEARQRRHSQMAALKQVVATADASNSSLQEKSGSHRKLPGLDDEEVSHDGSHKSHGSHWSKNSRGSAGGGARSDSWRRGMAPPGKDHTHRPQILQKPPASPHTHRKGKNASPMGSPKQPSKTMATSSGMVGRHVITTGEGTKVEYKGGGSSLAMAVSNLKEGNKHYPKQNHPKPTIQRLSDGSVRISKDGGNRQPKGPPKNVNPNPIPEATAEKHTKESKVTASEEVSKNHDSSGVQENQINGEVSDTQEVETHANDGSQTPNIDEEEESSVGGRSFNSAGGRSSSGRSKRGRGGRGRSSRGSRGSGRGRDGSGRGRDSSGRGRDGRDGSGRGRESSGRGRGSARGKGKSNYRAPRPAGPNAKSHSYHIEIGAKPS